jgi:hypothetical protein
MNREQRKTGEYFFREKNKSQNHLDSYSSPRELHVRQLSEPKKLINFSEKPDKNFIFKSSKVAINTRNEPNVSPGRRYFKE